MAARNMLDETFNVDDEPEEAAPSGAPEAEAPEAEAAAEPAAAKTPIGRRGRAAAAQAELVARLDAIAKQNETVQERLERSERDNAELRGHVQGLASRPAYEQPRERQPEAPDPDKLLKEANDALDAKDFATYQRKFMEAAAASARRGMPAQVVQQQAPTASPMLQVVMSQYADVVTNRASMEIAQAHDRILHAQGVPDGPDRWKKAFEEGRRYLGGKEGATKVPSYDQKSRGALAGVPTSSNGGGGGGGGQGEPGVTLTALERSYARKFKMTDAQYAKHRAIMNPERVER